MALRRPPKASILVEVFAGLLTVSCVPGCTAQSLEKLVAVLAGLFLFGICANLMLSERLGLLLKTKGLFVVESVQVRR